MRGGEVGVRGGEVRGVRGGEVGGVVRWSEGW